MVGIAARASDSSINKGGTSPDFLAGGGEMGSLLRATDWTRTPLGPPEGWPISLKTAVGIMLSSRYAMFVWWGRELVNLYNDAYRPFLGRKHPDALGRSAKDVWAEIWDLIGPRTDAVLERAESTFDEALLLIMERNGYPEETYFTFSYSPLRNDAGEIGGIFAAVTDETLRIIRERRLRTLRDVAGASAEAHDPEQVCAAAAAGMGRNPWGIPFTLIYLLRPGEKTANLAGHAGIDGDWPGAPRAIELDGEEAPWPLAQAMATGETVIIEELSSRLDHVPLGAWDRPPHAAIVTPLKDRATGGVAGFLIAGLNPYRLPDEEYLDFLGLLANQIAAGIGNARAYQEQRRRAEALAEVDRAKTAFFSNVSHEFRTPLTLILGSLEELLAKGAGSNTASIHESGTIAHRNALRLLKLVNTLLDFSRIEAGRTQASYEPTDVARLTAELASSFRSACDRAGLTLKIICPPLDEPAFIDPDMWEQIVLNLVSNAFKFTFEGTIAVEVARSADHAAVELIVSDTGTGIPDHELPHLFERFHRVEGAKGRSFEGSGIGLALVHELVKLHGGSITAESKVEQGTTFVVRIPLGAAHLPQDRVRDARAAPAGKHGQAFVEEVLSWLPGDESSGADDFSLVRSIVEELDATAVGGATGRVLLVDDNIDMRNYVRRLLVDQGYEVEAASDGEVALDTIRKRAPELVLSDVMMPRLDGFGLLQRLRADPATRDIPVILLSARAAEDARLEGIGAGADDYLIKPFSARELLARVSSNLRLARVRREAMEAVRARTMELETVLETVPTGVWFTHDPEARSVTANRQAAQLLRLPPEQITSLAASRDERPNIAVLRDGVEVPRRNLPLARAARGEAVCDEEIEFRFADGSATMLLAHANPLRDVAGEVVGAVAAVTDITARKTAELALRELNENLEQQVAAEIEHRLVMEHELRQAQKMEAIGQLTGGVAHDLNNLLLVIQASVERLERQNFLAESAAARAVRMALGAVERAASLTHRLLAFARRQPLAPKAIDPNRLVAGMLELLRRTLSEAVVIETVIAGGMWRIFADPSQLENAILNLAVNGRDAMPDGGRLTIETANAYLDESYVAHHPDVVPGQYGLIAVSDNGTGMTSEQIERAFEPFFTTKEVGQGTGLGLSQVYGFVKQSGGHVKIYSELGEGTTVRMYLPRHAGGEESETSERPLAPPPLARPDETILVVEDNDDVRATSVEGLRELGYRVVEARDGAEALRLLDADPSIGLMFTDVGLPGGQNGRQLADAARQHRADLKILFTSAYARNAIMHNGRLDPGVELVVKPYTYANLAAKIRAVLDSGSR